MERPGQEGWFKAGRARITVHRDGKKPIFEGSLRINGIYHHIQTGAHYQRVRDDDDPVLSSKDDSEETMVVWRDSDILSSQLFTDLKRSEPNAALCNSDNLGFNSRFNELQDFGAFDTAGADSHHLFGRQSIDGGSTGNNGAGVNLEDSIGSVNGCPTTRRVALVGIATDCTYTAEFNSSEALRRSVIDMVNRASEVFESTFNISLGIHNLTISDANCPGTPSDAAPWNRRCANDVDLSDRLSLFSAWRGNFEDSNAYWTLLTTCATDSAVGLAWLGQLCRPGASSDGQQGNETVAATNVVVKTPSEWQVFAHETGHTFGAVHDCTGTQCPVSSDSQSCCPLSRSSCDANGQYIMNPSTADRITEFSPCSIGNICSGFRRNVNADCLTDNKNITTITGSQCGNGIVESGEDCDCGGEDECGENSCCDPETCTYRDGAQCDPANENCCTDECQYASSNTVCRESTGECDPEETCPGNSASCPTDEHLDDGESCGEDGLSCASGQCTSRDEQCQVMYGNQTSGRGVEACSSSCLLSCRVTGGDGVCTQRSQNFIDGTSCSGGGRCQNGRCRGASTIKEIRDWLERNKNIAIPVGSVLAALLLLVVLCCIWSCIKKARNRRRAPKATEMTSWPAHGNQMYPPQYSYAPSGGNPQQFQYNRTRSMRYA